MSFEVGWFAINFFTTWIVAFVLFLRWFLLSSTSRSFASLFGQRIGEGGRCGRVSILSEVRRALILYFRLLAVGSLLVKIRQNPRHHEQRGVVLHQGLFHILPDPRGGRDLGFNLPVAFRGVNNCTTGHWNKALCCKVIHFVFQTASSSASYDIQKEKKKKRRRVREGGQSTVVPFV